MLKQNLAQPVVVCTIVFSVFVLLLSLFDAALGEFLEYDQSKIRQGEFWRLLTGNFVHFGLYHTVMNLLSVALIGFCLYVVFPFWIWFALLFVVPLMDGCGLFFMSPNIEVYRGYSGAVYGLAFVGLILNWKFNPWVASVVIAGLWGKLFYERQPNYDVNFLVDKIGVPVAVDAHLWGGVAGMILSVPLYYLVKKYHLVNSPASTG